MDSEHFDQWTRSLSGPQTRRTAVTMIVGSGLATLLSQLDIGEVAACRRAKKRCKRDAQCCSGRCTKGHCKGNAQPDEPTGDVCLGRNPQDVCGDGCFCFVSVSGAIFCGDAGPTIDCSADADCDAVTGTGSICFFNKNGDGQCAAACSNPL
jgi:hypothetical protein